MSKRHRNERPLGDVIKDLMKIYKLDGRYNEARVKDAWHKVMGSMVQNRTLEIYFKQGILYVRLDSGVLKEEFSLGKNQIISLLNAELKEEGLVRDIFIK